MKVAEGGGREGEGGRGGEGKEREVWGLGGCRWFRVLGLGGLWVVKSLAGLEV